MTAIVPRTCTEITKNEKRRNSEAVSQPLEAFRSVPAYVLLGDPGAGKTTAFGTECCNMKDGHYISARDFLTFGVSNRSECQGKTLFIDGLDEVRAGKSDVRVPFDEIRKRLDELGKPRFRLSCREADWLGENDRKNLEDISPDNSVVMLRLDPLTESDVISILQSHPEIEDASAFIEKARQVGIEGLLENPQSLIMLAASVTGDNDWPQSRLEVFELASLEMASEHNEEHTIADQAVTEGVLANPDQLLDAAGRLCALMLISGAAGFALPHGKENADFPAWDRCEYDHPEYLKSALSTKLFKAESAGRFAPVHRHVAEFLAGRHLGRIINGEIVQTKRYGLPTRRVIALIAGEDGTVVTELRGLSAWLAGLCKSARHDLIDRDPIGIGLYGDISAFSVIDKTKLLESMRYWFRDHDSMIRSEISTFAALATPDMELKLREILTDSGRDREYQLLTEFVLRILAQCDKKFDLSITLCEILRDETRWPRVRKWALNTYIQFETHMNGTDMLHMFLEEIYRGHIPDHDRELLGTLLTRLYPRDLPPSEVWRYLSDGGSNIIGHYRVFWYDIIVEKSSDDQIVELLDSLSIDIEELSRAIDYHNLASLPIKILARGLATRGDSIGTVRLYDWLGVACERSQRRALVNERAFKEVKEWLEQRPAAQKAIVLECLTRYAASDRYKHHTYSVRDRLYNSELPADFGPWCLRMAEEMEHVNPRVVDCLIETAISAYRNPNDNYGLTRARLDEFVQTHESFRARIDQLLAPLPIEEKYREEETKAENEYLKRESKWIQKVRESVTALRENRAAPAILFEIAQTYFDYSIDFRGIDGREKIHDRLGGNQSLTDAAIQGLEGTLNRRDIPKVKTILDQYEHEQVHYLSWPFLAGLDLIERQDPEDVFQWDEHRCRTALAFYYCTAQSSYQPRWYKWLLHKNAELVSDLLTVFTKVDFQRAKEGIQQLQVLVYDNDHAKVAKISSLRLLRSFPIRCGRDLLPSLDYLLCAAMRHADRTLYQELIAVKLSRKSMNVTQRARWLAAGIIVSPGKYESQLTNFVWTGRGHKKRISNFADFLSTNDYVQSITENLDIQTLKLLISVIGSTAGPDERPGTSDDRSATAAGFYSSEMHASSFVHRMIDRLGSISTIEATNALTMLQNDEYLVKWQYNLSNRLANLKSIRRNEEYRHSTVDEICQTLKGGTPANAGDLAALVMDRLAELATTIRDGNTDDWRQYWNLPHGQPPTPRHEDHCRDALLSDLRQRLPEDVDAQPEGQYANDKRADMRIAFRNFQVPVEVKKNCHRDLWSAMHKQLIKHYVRDPATDGYGIYLVFWFGEDCTQAPPEGKLPGSPEESQERLVAALSPEEARKISVCVIDVSSNLIHS